jgi:transcriptional regulator with XRE-family HTH domain
MGRGTREKPTKLAKKLAQIRMYLAVSQDGLVRALGLSAKLTRNDISKYERGLREPALPVLLKYARAAKVNVEVIIDDDLELPLIFRQLDTRKKRVNKRARKSKV